VSRQSARIARIRLQPGSRLSSDSAILARDPKISFPVDEIAKLAENYKIDQTTLEVIIADAACHYHALRWSTGEGYDDRDTLDKIEKPAAELSRLLSENVNHHRLAMTLFEDGGESALRKFCEEAIPFLDDVRLAARKAHRSRERGRPKARGDLEGAYQSLAKWYRRLFGDVEFTSSWEASNSYPTSPAACFLYDVMTLIDPDRPHLPKELRDLMTETVSNIPGPRRGRRG
jgi:hypothetical protein